MTCHDGIILKENTKNKKREIYKQVLPIPQLKKKIINNKLITYEVHVEE